MRSRCFGFCFGGCIMASGELVVASWPAGGWWLHHGQRGAGGCIMTCLALMILVLVVNGRTLASAVTLLRQQGSSFVQKHATELGNDLEQGVSFRSISWFSFTPAARGRCPGVYRSLTHSSIPSKGTMTPVARWWLVQSPRSSNRKLAETMAPPVEDWQSPLLVE